ncbi:MAG: outer membrane protein assembly factor BamD [bacterium]
MSRISSITAVSLLGLALLAGCGRVRLDETLNPIEQWQLAKAYFDDENYLDAKDVLTAFTLNYSGESLIDSAQFLLGECHFAMKEYIIAMSEYNRLIQNFPQSPLGVEAQLRIILCNLYLSPRCELDQKYTERTIVSIQDFLDDYPTTSIEVHLRPQKTTLNTLRWILTLGIWKPTSKSVSEIPVTHTRVVFPHRDSNFGQWLLRALTLGLYKPAKSEIKLPASEIVAGDVVVQRALAECRARLAKKEYKSGELYFHMKKYPSAVIYFDSVLGIYDDTPWVEDALRLKGYSLFAMHKYVEAAQCFEKYLRDGYSEDRERVNSRLQECQQRLSISLDREVQETDK